MDRQDLSNIQDYLEDMMGQEMPARLDVSMTADGLYWRARIVDVDGPGEALLDRMGNQFMDVTHKTMQGALEWLDDLAAVKPEEN